MTVLMPIVHVGGCCVVDGGHRTGVGRVGDPDVLMD